MRRPRIPLGPPRAEGAVVPPTGYDTLQRREKTGCNEGRLRWLSRGGSRRDPVRYHVLGGELTDLPAGLPFPSWLVAPLDQLAPLAQEAFKRRVSVGLRHLVKPLTTTRLSRSRPRPGRPVTDSF